MQCDNKETIIVIGNNSGGMFDFRGLLLDELRKKNFRVVVLTPFDTNVEDLKSLGIGLIETPIERRGMNPITDLKLLKLYRTIIKREKPKLVITYTIKPNIYGGFACRSRKIPYVVNITGLGFVFQQEGILRKAVTLLYKSAIKKASVVFFENSENKQVFVNEGICSERRTYVLNGAGVDLEKFLIKEYPKENSSTDFLFMGRVMKEKGIDELFEAMHRLYAEGYDCTLTVLGNYEEDYRETIEKYSEEGWLDYQGFQEDVRPFIERCHCFVLPSWHEGMANTNLECAAMGRPVITSNIHGCMEAVEDGVSGFLCNKQDTDDLYRVMKEFIGLSYEKRKEMGLVGRKRMEELFDKRVVVQKTMERLFDKE